MHSGEFLQSNEWGEFQRSIGRKVVRVEGVGQFLIHTLPLGQTYAYCPRGPLTDVSIEQLRSVADDLGVLFLRLEPSSNFKFRSSNLRKSLDISPPHTLITDLTQTEDKLLADMHEKTRYNIRLAERKGVKIDVQNATLDEVWPLFEQTAKRGQFHLHPKWYYKTMLEFSTAFLATARFEGELVAANIMIDQGLTRTYLHGSSSDHHRQVMAPYLLHWQLMIDAKKQGLTTYDWWGIAPSDSDQNHAWSGITRFKLGFGGIRVDYPGTFDFVAHPFKYALYQILRSIRRLIR